MSYNTDDMPTEKVAIPYQEIFEYQVKGFLTELKCRYSMDEVLRIESAVHVMQKAHRTQFRMADNSPYIFHPLEVAQRTENMIEKPNPDMLISALLHDSVEDQPRQLVKILGVQTRGLTVRDNALVAIDRTYGHQVREMVGNLTNPNFKRILRLQGIHDHHPHYNRERNKLYTEHLLRISHDDETIVIKLADFLSNGSKMRYDQQFKLAVKYAPSIEIMRTAIIGSKIMSEDAKIRSLVYLSDVAQTIREVLS